MNFFLISLIAAICTGVPSVFGQKSDLMARTASPECRAWVDSVYNSLSERERVAQLFCPTIRPNAGEETKATIKRLVGDEHVGAVLFSKGTVGEYAAAIDYAQSVAKVPVLVTLDGEWGLSMRMPDAPRFPKNMGLGAIRNKRLLYDYGREVARECRALGIHVNFAPVLDVNSNPQNPVIGHRSFGEDPENVADAGVAYSLGLEDGGVQAVAKHFPGHGDTDSDSHKTLPTVDHSMATLEAVDLLPFRKFIEARLSGIMVGHLNVPSLDPSGAPASLSPLISDSLLHHRMGFRGITYTDALGMQGAQNRPGNVCVNALRAGADILLDATSVKRDIDAVLKYVGSDTIEQRCKKILAYKYALGLNDAAAVDGDAALSVINSPQAEKIIQQLANASMTCLRNRGNVLPVSDLAHKSIAVVIIGDDTDNTFADYCRRYAKVDVYHGTGDISQIRAHDLVIAAVFSDGAAARNALAQLGGSSSLVAAFMVNPYRMARFGASLDKVDGLILAYDDTPSTARAAVMAIFGGIDVDGRLPVNLHGIDSIGAGIDLRKCRLGYATPLAAGMRPELTDSIDSIINDAIARGAFPGAQIVVGRHGDIVVDRSYGRTTKGGEKVDFSTLYDLASVSKTVGTLPGVMKAYDLGLFDLDKPASQYIAGLRDQPDKQHITPRGLLYHETGMPPSLDTYRLMFDPATYSGQLITGRRDKHHTKKIGPRAWGHNSARLRTDILSTSPTERHNVHAAKGLFVGRDTYDTIMNRIYTIPLRENKGFLYSCLNFCLLMDMEQQLTGQPHQQWIADSVWAPLGAYGFTYRAADSVPLSRIAATEVDSYGRRQHVHGYVHDELAAWSGGVQGNAGVFGSATDIAKLCQMWLNGGTYGDARILSPETTALFTTDKSPNSRRGLGFDKPDTTDPDSSPTCEEAGPAVFGHTGFTGTIFWVDPENDLFFVFLCNRVDPTRDNAAFRFLSVRPELFRQVLNSVY